MVWWPVSAWVLSGGVVRASARSLIAMWSERCKLGGDLGRREVAREVPEDAQLGVAERVTRRRRFAVPLRRRRSGEHVEDVAPQVRERVLAAGAR